MNIIEKYGNKCILVKGSQIVLAHLNFIPRRLGLVQGEAEHDMKL